MTRKIFSRLLVGFFFLCFFLTGCSMGSNPDSLPKMTTADPVDSQSVIQTLQNATSIRLEKAVFSIGDYWTIKADGVEVANIKGQPIYLLGDTYSMFSKKGNLVGSEGESYRLVNHQAKLYDYNNEYTGEIDQEIFSFLYKFYFYDKNMKKIGQLDQNFSLTLNGDIKDSQGSVNWNFNKDFFSWGAALTLTRKSNEPQVDVMKAIWMTVIVNEISEAQNSDSGSSKSKSK